MDKYIESSIKARKDAIFNAYSVTDEGTLKKIDDLFGEIEKLGTECKDVSEFENKFAASLLNQKYMDIFTELAQGAPGRFESFRSQTIRRFLWEI